MAYRRLKRRLDKLKGAKVKRVILGEVLILMLLIALAGCKPKDPKAITVTDSADIYAAVIRQIASDDGNSRAVLYVIQTTNDRHAGEKQDRLFQPINNDVQKGIGERLHDHPAKIIWVSSNDEVPWENGQVKDRNAVIELGTLNPQKDGSVQAAATLTFANMGAFGKTYVLEQKDGLWTVTGTTGPEWIS